MAEAPGGARFIAPDASEIARIRAKHTYLKPLTVPANSYPTQTSAIDSVGSWSYILVRENLPDDVAYRLARTLHGVEAAFCAKLPQACCAASSLRISAWSTSAYFAFGTSRFRNVYFRPSTTVCP